MKKSILNKIVIVLLLCMCAVTAVFADDATVEVDRDQLSLGETLRLSFTVTGKYSSVTPNFSALENDFSIVARANSTQLVIVNGDSATTTQWVLTLLPKHKGVLQIPSIRFAGVFTKPTKVTVGAGQPMGAASSNKSVFLEVTVDDKSPYVQSQVLYKVKLYYSVSIANGSISPPDVPDAVVKRIRDDRHYQTKYRGGYYQVMERDYAIFPQKSGDVTIDGPIFTGVLTDGDPSLLRLSDVAGVVSGKPVKVQGNSIKLSILATPKAFTSNIWLPAKKILVKEAWASHSGQFKVGEPITRTLVIDAIGLTASQLPVLADDTVEGFNIYPDVPVTSDSLLGDDVISQRKEHLAYIPTTPGKLTLPAVSVAWWNIDTNKMEVATLPAKTFQVVGSPSGANDAAAAYARNPIDSLATPQTLLVNESSLWPWLTLLFAALWLVTLGAWWYRGRVLRYYFQSREQRELTKNQQAYSLRQARSSVKNACLNNKPTAVRDALIHWAALRWPQKTPKTLGAIADLVGSTDFSREVILLDKLLYTSEKISWQGRALWVAFEKFKDPIKRDAKAGNLPPLYPDRQQA